MSPRGAVVPARGAVAARAASGAILALCAVACYLVLAELLESGVGLDPLSAGIAAAAVVAVAVQGVRRPLRRAADRIVYGPDGDPARLLGRLGERVGEFDSGAEGLRRLAEALRDALPVAALEIVPDRPSEPAIRVGEPGDTPVVVELRAAGARLGELRAHPRAGERVPRATLERLEELSPVVATALRLAQASARLGDARDALVAARQRERRSLRRELHDGIGPALAGVGFGLAAVDNLRADDPPAAAALATRLATDLRDQLGEVRRLARSVRPEREVVDLVAELGELADDFAGSGVAVNVAVEGAWRVPDREVRPVFLVAAEAVHNAVRHAQASRVDIRLAESADGGVELAVSDDGRGFDAHRGAAGVGLSTMREHAAEIGAALEIRSAASGTSVLLRLPSPREVRP